MRRALLLATPALALAFAAVLLAERRWPLRRSVAPKSRRVAVNLGVGGVTAAAVRLVFVPVVVAAAGAADARGIGLLKLVALPPLLELAAALLLLDYTFYWWHRLMHRVPFLWRFHVVHHTDADLDVSTAARFHFGEYVLGTAYRALQIAVIGAGPTAAAAFETAIVLAAGFHHANVRLPVALERGLVRVVVTPRMHGIHHSLVRRETDSNWATVLTLWDRVHGTLRLNVPQAEIVIGLPAYREPVGFLRALALPFRRQALSWLTPAGVHPDRAQPGTPLTGLAA
jgi:sterol desaturase/sphingolipid hydroxylase (fatty acid hydroxylase superfamily)